MNKILNKISLISLLGSILISGCSKPGTDFVGTWVNDGNGKTMVVKQDGNSYLVTINNSILPATLQDNHLTVSDQFETQTMVKAENGKIRFNAYPLCEKNKCLYWTKQ